MIIMHDLYWQFKIQIYAGILVGMFLTGTSIFVEKLVLSKKQKEIKNISNIFAIIIVIKDGSISCLNISVRF